MSNVINFCHARRPTRRMKTTWSIDAYVTHMEQKCFYAIVCSVRQPSKVRNGSQWSRRRNPVGPTSFQNLGNPHPASLLLPVTSCDVTRGQTFRWDRHPLAPVMEILWKTFVYKKNGAAFHVKLFCTHICALSSWICLSWQPHICINFSGDSTSFSLTKGLC